MLQCVSLEKAVTEYRNQTVPKTWHDFHFRPGSPFSPL